MKHVLLEEALSTPIDLQKAFGRLAGNGSVITAAMEAALIKLKENDTEENRKDALVLIGALGNSQGVSMESVSIESVGEVLYLLWRALWAGYYGRQDDKDRAAGRMTYDEKKAEEKRQKEGGYTIDEIIKGIKSRYLNESWLNAATFTTNPLDGSALSMKIHRPGKYDGDLAKVFLEGTSNLKKFHKVVMTKVEPFAKMITEEDQRLCKLADSMDTDNEKDCERLDKEMEKSIKRLKGIKAPIKELFAAGSWYLTGLEVEKGRGVYTEEAISFNYVKPAGEPIKTVAPLDKGQVRDIGQAIIDLLQIFEEYRKNSARRFAVYNDDGENLRDFYDYTSNMDDYYDLVDGESTWADFYLDEPYDQILKVCQVMFGYIDKSVR